MSGTLIAQERMLFSFDRPDDLRGWRTVDDVVMGGRSGSYIVPTAEGTALFEGVLSLENNGGFASVRSGSARYDLRGFDGIRLRVRGDGRRYGFNVRTAELFQPLRYEETFDTAPGRWQIVSIPFAALRARAFGTDLPAPPPGLRSIRSFGFIIADKQAGHFRLEIAWIRAYREGGEPQQDSP